MSNTSINQETVNHRVNFKRARHPSQLRYQRKKAAGRHEALSEAAALIEKAREALKRAASELESDFNEYEPQNLRDHELDEQMGELLCSADVNISGVQREANYLLTTMHKAHMVALALKDGHPERFPCLNFSESDNA